MLKALRAKTLRFPEREEILPQDYNIEILSKFPVDGLP